ncbi:hypothetical protein CPT_Suso_014 [Stenotrophomonas phage Suso]|nr:hypothetical protein CPT_Suso_014 [Stenotrophomonas phage Suso]
MSRRNRSEAWANQQLAQRPIPVAPRIMSRKPPTVWQRLRALAKRLGLGVHRGDV